MELTRPPEAKVKGSLSWVLPEGMLPGMAGHAVGLEPPGAVVVVVVGLPPPTEVVEVVDVVRVVGAGAAVVVPVPGMH